jgi:CDP-glucose 4,6-dehydratase
MIDSAFWSGKRVFLTGHTGFKGSWLSIWLTSLGATVRGYALPAPTDPALFHAADVAAHMDSQLGDVCDASTLAASLHAFKPEIVIHMAAQPLVRASYQNPVGTYATNVMGTVHLLEAVRQCEGVKAVVVVTTDKCYENREWEWGYRENEPMGGYDPYSNSKGCAELVTDAYRRSFFGETETAVATGRAGNVIGGGDWAEDRLIPDILTAFGEGRPAIVRNPDAIRPWQHVLEPLSGYLVLAQRLYSDGQSVAKPWNFGPWDEGARPVNWIAAEMAQKWGDGAGWELLGDSTQPHEATYLKLDISRARTYLDWRPTWALAETLERIVNWQKAFIGGADARALCLEEIAAFGRAQA